MKMTINGQDVIKVKDVAKKSDMTVQAIYIAIRKGKIPHIKHDNIMYVKEDDVKSIVRYARKK